MEEQASNISNIIIVACAAIGIGFYLYQKNKRINTNKHKQSWKERDPERYERDKNIIKDAIQKKNYDVLEEMLNSTTQDFPDLIAQIQQALKDRK